MEPWYIIHNVDTLDTPALIFYPDRMEKNLDILKTFVSDTSRIRPHIKTNKCVEVARLMMKAGIAKFKCATIAEAEMLAMAGASDVLLAYQPVGPKALRLCDLQRRYPQTSFACLVDSPDVLSEVGATASENNAVIRVFIDLNVGMNRTGIPAAEAFALFQSVLKTKHIAFAGLHLYDGHIRDRDLHTRTARCDEAFLPVTRLRDDIASVLGKHPAVVAGGTPTFPIHAKRADVEVSPGTFILWDYGYSQLLPDQPFLFAAAVITRVISTPGADTLCLDLGHKSIAAENPIANRVHLVDAPDLEPIGHSEEHMVFRSGTNHRYTTGHVFYGIPHHICPTVALYEEAVVCQNHIARDTWPIAARKRKITV